MTKKNSIFLKGVAGYKEARWNGHYWESKIGTDIEDLNNQLKSQGYKIIKKESK